MKELLLTSSVLILALTALRFLFRNSISRRLQYGLWLLVALRLVLPVTLLSSSFSVLSGAEALSQHWEAAQTAVVSEPEAPETSNPHLSRWSCRLSARRPSRMPQRHRMCPWSWTRQHSRNRPCPGIKLPMGCGLLEPSWPPFGCWR